MLNKDFKVCKTYRLHKVDPNNCIHMCNRCYACRFQAEWNEDCTLVKFDNGQRPKDLCGTDMYFEEVE